MTDGFSVSIYRWFPEIVAALGVALIAVMYVTVGLRSPLAWPNIVGGLVVIAGAVWVRYDVGYADETGSGTDRCAGGEGR
jgi:hypothetical protein